MELLAHSKRIVQRKAGPFLKPFPPQKVAIYQREN